MSLRNESQGFTLIELVFAVSLIGIILTITWPKMDRVFSRYRLEIGGNKLIADLRLVQQLSIGEGIWYKLKFDTVNNRYIITRNVNEGGVAQTYKIVEPEKPVKLYFTNFQDNAVYFYSSGSPSQGGTVTITDDKGSLIYVIVSPVTGRTRLSDKPPA